MRREYARAEIFLPVSLSFDNLVDIVLLVEPIK